MSKILDEKYFSAPATERAPDLIGKLLCVRREDGSIIRARITETECYFGEQDSACHASRGRTPRTDTLYMGGGVAYVYLCYGIHSLLNVVTGPADFPEAVLIRGVEGFEGPGKLTKAMMIDRSLNGTSFIDSNELWIEDDGVSASYNVGKRIGIDYATDEYRNILWRFTIKK